jgi:peptide/nickel transport system substrate-binding protein
MKKKLFALLAALAMIAAACGSDEASDTTTTTAEEGGGDGEETTTTATPAPEGTEAGSGGNLLLLQWQAPSQANSLLSSGSKDVLAGSLVLEPLAESDPSGALVPALATEIPTVGNGGISEDGLSITWKLQEGILWSDGTPLTADDVLFTYEYCTDEATGCSNESFVDVASVVADDDLTVTITFNDPTPFPFVPFVTWLSPVIQRAQFADCVGAAAKSCSEENFAPVGTGPYVVTDLRPEDTVTYEMNPLYRGVPDGKPFFGTVEIKGGGDAEAAARSVLEVGEADYGWNLQVAPEILAQMESAGNGRLVSGFASNVEHIQLNQTDPFADPPSELPNPLFVDNPDLHKALSISINRDALVQVGYGPTGRPTCNIWPVGVENSTNLDECLTQDTDGANALLDGLGYLDTDGDGVREADGYGPLEFDYVTSTNGVRQSNQELVKADWALIGVKANMINEDASLFFDGTCASDACIWKFTTPIQMYTNGNGLPDGVDYLGGFISSQIPTSATSWGGENIVRFNSSEFDALEASAKALALDDPARVEAIIAMNDLVSSNAIIPLVYRASASAFANSMAGIGDLNGWDSEYWNIEDWFRNE